MPIFSHRLARRLVLVGLVIAATFHVDEVMKASGNPGFLPLVDRATRTLLLEGSATSLSVLSFIIMRDRPSFIVSLSLLISGILITADEITIGTQYLSILAAPAPVIGLLLGIIVLVLGATKMLQFASAMKSPAADKRAHVK